MHPDLEKLFPQHTEKTVNVSEMSPAERIERAQAVRILLASRGFTVLNEYVMYVLDSLRAQIGTAKTEEIQFIQGRVEGIQAYQNAVSVVLDDGEKAEAALKENDEIQKEMDAEGHPT